MYLMYVLSASSAIHYIIGLLGLSPLERTDLFAAMNSLLIQEAPNASDINTMRYSDAKLQALGMSQPLSRQNVDITLKCNGLDVKGKSGLPAVVCR